MSPILTQDTSQPPPNSTTPYDEVHSRGRPPRSGPSPVSRFESALLRRLLRAYGQPNVAIKFWDGSEIPAPGSAHATVVIRDRGTLWKLAFDPSLQFGDAYADGRIEVQGDLAQAMSEIFLAMNRVHRPPSLISRLASRMIPRRRNTLRASRRNIHVHYDIGNDFYRLWLDEQLAYTCAYFRQPQLTLEQAQVEKFDLVCRKLWLQPGEHVVEAGCGWGALALHMAKHYGVTVKAYNISREQIAYARRRAQQEGLADRVEFVEDDWRKIDSPCDAFVSVGMLEHVGPSNYAQLADVIHACLPPHGRGLIHSIGRNVAQPFTRWIERRIFPGAHPPSLSQAMPIFERHGMSVLDVENLRLHYRKTLRHWLVRFEEHVDEVREEYGERFVRMWRLYLAGSIAAFDSGSMQLFQIVFAREPSNDIPWTRMHQHPQPGGHGREQGE